MSKTKNTDVEVGEQLQLIDVLPKKAKPIIKQARIYKRFQLARKAALKAEVEQKQKVLNLVKAANIKSLKDGVIRFTCDDVTICITPRDELLQIREDAD